ncbi:hypothetical protein DV515_00012533, partial [Chloebia gouldiae]
ARCWVVPALQSPGEEAVTLGVESSSCVLPARAGGDAEDILPGTQRSFPTGPEGHRLPFYASPAETDLGAGARLSCRLPTGHSLATHRHLHKNLWLDSRQDNTHNPYLDSALGKSCSSPAALEPRNFCCVVVHACFPPWGRRGSGMRGRDPRGARGHTALCRRDGGGAGRRHRGCPRR